MSLLAKRNIKLKPLPFLPPAAASSSMPSPDKIDDSTRPVGLVIFDFDSTLTNKFVPYFARFTNVEEVQDFLCPGYEQVVRFLKKCEHNNVHVGISSFNTDTAILSFCSQVYLRNDGTPFFTETNVDTSGNSNSFILKNESIEKIAARVVPPVPIKNVLLIDDDANNVNRHRAQGGHPMPFVLQYRGQGLTDADISALDEYMKKSNNQYQ